MEARNVALGMGCRQGPLCASALLCVLRPTPHTSFWCTMQPIVFILMSQVDKKKCKSPTIQSQAGLLFRLYQHEGNVQILRLNHYNIFEDYCTWLRTRHKQENNITVGRPEENAESPVETLASYQKKKKKKPTSDSQWKLPGMWLPVRNSCPTLGKPHLWVKSY